jgi:hypothetical protein
LRVDEDYLLYIIYPAAILLADYSYSQKMELSEILYFRIIMAVSAILLVIPAKFELALFLRIILVCLLIFIALIKKCQVRKIKVNSGVGFLLGVYSSYSLVLYLIACIQMDPEILKEWYVAVQIGLVCKLKIMDFKIRSNENEPKLIDIFAPIVFLFSLLIINYLHLNFMASLLFVIGYSGLMYVERKYMYEKYR